MSRIVQPVPSQSGYTLPSTGSTSDSVMVATCSIEVPFLAPLSPTRADTFPENGYVGPLTPVFAAVPGLVSTCAPVSRRDPGATRRRPRHRQIQLVAVGWRDGSQAGGASVVIPQYPVGEISGLEAAVLDWAAPQQLQQKWATARTPRTRFWPPFTGFITLACLCNASTICMFDFVLIAGDERKLLNGHDGGACPCVSIVHHVHGDPVEAPCVPGR